MTQAVPGNTAPSQDVAIRVARSPSIVQRECNAIQAVFDTH
jgi:hypothetical protein